MKFASKLNMKIVSLDNKKDKIKLTTTPHIIPRIMDFIFILYPKIVKNIGAGTIAK